MMLRTTARKVQFQVPRFFASSQLYPSNAAFLTESTSPPSSPSWRQHKQKQKRLKSAMTDTVTSESDGAETEEENTPCKIKITINSNNSNSLIHQLPPIFLRLSSNECYDPATHQRNDVITDAQNGKLLQHSMSNSKINFQQSIANVTRTPFCKIDKDNDNKDYHNDTTNDNGNDNDGNGSGNNDLDCDYIVEFGDGHKSTFSSEWVKLQVSRLGVNLKNNNEDYDDKDNDAIKSSSLPLPSFHDISPNFPRIPWSNATEEQFRSDRMSMDFKDIVLSRGPQPQQQQQQQQQKDNDMHIQNAIEILYKYGVLLVTSTPFDDNGSGISALASAISGSAHKSSQSSNTSPLQHYRQCHEDEHEHGNGNDPRPILEHATEGPYRTLYGGIWGTHTDDMTEGTSVADSAYSKDALPLHTDLSYYRDPPGLQLFTMANPADEGGETVLADGLAVSEYMRVNYPKDFDVLCKTVRRYRCFDESLGWHLEGSGPVIQAIDRGYGHEYGHGHGHGYTSNGNDDHDNDHDHNAARRWGAVVGIRQNDLDRLPDLPPPGVGQQQHQPEGYDKYYRDLMNAQNIWDTLLSRDEFRLVVKLKPGETAVVANQVSEVNWTGLDWT